MEEIMEAIIVASAVKARAALSHYPCFRRNENGYKINNTINELSLPA